MPTLTTLAEVSDRVDAMNQNCHDALVAVPAIFFKSLETMKIRGERHTLRTIAQRSITWRLGIPYNIGKDKMTPGLSIGNSEIGLASLSVSAFILRLVCTNGMVAKTKIAAFYRHVSTKILAELPQMFEKVGSGLNMRRDRLKLSFESPVSDPLAAIKRFNRQFALEEREKEAFAWAWPQEAGETMFNFVNAYRRAAAMDGLPAESSFRLQRVRGEVLGMLR